MGRRLLILGQLLAIALLVACGSPSKASPPDPTETPAETPTGTPPPSPPTATPGPISTTIIERYTVKRGDTLAAIAARFGMTVEDLQKLNGLANPNALQAGQVLKISIEVPRMAPAEVLIPDSEAVYGPAFQSFDTVATANASHGYLASYRERVEGDWLTGPEIVQLVAERYSVGPRVLLALLELESGWVTSASVPQSEASNPLGYGGGQLASLFIQLSRAADELNEGYYGKLSGQLAAIKLKDGSRARLAPGVNPGTAAVQNALAQIAIWDTWQKQVSPNGFLAAYQRLFGDPNAQAVVPLIPPDLKQPKLHLPWGNGITWYFTGGPHSGWGEYAAWASLDMTPGDMAGSGSCLASRDWVIAAAAGKVVRAEHGRVIVSLSNNNSPGSGWDLLYMHVATAGRVAAGVQVNVGDHIGHPSCEGGAANASHSHFARLYNGQWITADTIPFVLSGWTVAPTEDEYEGKLARGSESREACDCRDDSINAVRADDGPP